MRVPLRPLPVQTQEDLPLVQVAIPERYYEGLYPNFANALRALDEAAPPGIYEHIGAMSGYRSVEHQRRLYENALERYGSEAEARRWVAPPGNSRHNNTLPDGTPAALAMDLTYGTDEARQWVHDNAARFGLHFPMDWENWHIEPMGPGGGRIPLGGSAPVYDPARPPSVFNPPPGYTPPGQQPNEENALMALIAEMERRQEEEQALNPEAFMSRRGYGPIAPIGPIAVV